MCAVGLILLALLVFMFLRRRERYTMPMITTGPRTMATTAPGVTKQRTMQEMIAYLSKSREGKDLVKNMKNTPGPTASVITSPGMYKCESDSTGFRCTRAS